MENQEVQVKDLYEGAYLLCRGFHLKHLSVMDTYGKKLVTFHIAGNGVITQSQEYRQGQATANVALLKFTMEKLKDKMFERIRNLEIKERALCLDYQKREKKKTRLTRSNGTILSKK
jgi:hypothetical protein